MLKKNKGEKHMPLITKEEFSQRMDEIERLQEQVGKILCHKSKFYRWFFFRKAKRLHYLAEELMNFLYLCGLSE